MPIRPGTHPRLGTVVVVPFIVRLFFLGQTPSKKSLILGHYTPFSAFAVIDPVFRSSDNPLYASLLAIYPTITPTRFYSEFLAAFFRSPQMWEFASKTGTPSCGLHGCADNRADMSASFFHFHFFSPFVIQV